jgi:hypothetical protein
MINSTIITKEQTNYADNLACQINKLRRNDNLFDRNLGKISLCIDKIGFLGETLFADYFKLNRPVVLKGNDVGIDFEFNGLKIDVKTSTYPLIGKADLILYPKDLEKQSNYFYLIQLYKNQAFFLGGISKADFIAKCKLKNFGYGERFIVESKDLQELNPVKALSTLDEVP